MSLTNAEQERERSVRDVQAADYEGVRRRAYFRWFEILERRALLGVLKPPVRGWLLDAGCSTGRLTSVLEKAAERVVSADFSLGSLRFAARRLPGARYLQADLSAPPFRKAFSAVVCLDVLHCLPPDKRLEVVRSFREIVCDDGVVVASIWNRASFTRIFDLPPEGHFPSGIYYQAMTEPETADMFRRAGFSRVRITGLGYVLYWVRSIRYTSTLYRRLGWASLPLELLLARRSPPAGSAKSLYSLIVARK